MFVRPPEHFGSSARRRTAIIVMMILLLAGCGLRLETPDPTEPVPDAAELLRAGAVAEALELASVAGQAEDSGEEATALLAEVRDTAEVHAAQLGGIYESGLDLATEQSSAPAATTTTTTDAAGVLTLLFAAADSARAGALTADTAPVARLLASVAAAREQEIQRMIAVLGDGAPVRPESAEEPSADSTDTQTSAPADDTATADTTRQTLIALTAAEDQAGYGYEVAAARLSDDDRSRALDLAADHRSWAETWAQAAGVSASTDDPRRAAYSLGSELDGPEAIRAFCAGLEQQLTDGYANAVLATAAGSTERALIVDRLIVAATTLLTWGGAATALPGMDDPIATTPAPDASASTTTTTTTTTS